MNGSGWSLNQDIEGSFSPVRDCDRRGVESPAMSYENDLILSSQPPTLEPNSSPFHDHHTVQNCDSARSPIDCGEPYYGTSEQGDEESESDGSSSNNGGVSMSSEG